MLESYTPNPQVDLSLGTELRDDNCATRHRPRELHYGRIWSPERDEQLIALKEAPERWTDKQIGDAMGLGPDQIRARLRVLHIAGITIVRAAPPIARRRAYTPRESGSRDARAWPDAEAARLAGLWDEGLSTSDIGLRLGRTKNAIVGMAHRLGLPARPSPIRRDGEASPVREPRVRVPACTLPPLGSMAEAPSEPSPRARR